MTGPRLTRRAALLGLSCVAAAGASAAPLSDIELQPALRLQAAKSGIKFGIAGPPPSMQPDSMVLATTAVEAEVFSPEGGLKWVDTEPRPNGFDFTAGDSLADFAGRNDMVMHGHTLVWYAALPPWVLQLANPRDAEAALERHIATLMARYRGKVWAWDVVNEPVEPVDGLPEGHRKSVWYRLLGENYLDLSFRLARQADPAVPLCLNEYGFEYADAPARAKRHALLALLRKLKDRGVAIDRLGLQAHLEAHRSFDRAGLTEFLKAARWLGCDLMITELDVNDVRIPGDIPARDRAVARHADEFLDIVFSVAKPKSLTTWGLSDRRTWMVQYYKRGDGKPLRPLPLDADLVRKPLWAVLAKYLAA